VRPAEERQHVMLTQRVKLDVADDDHFVVFNLEERVIDQCHRVRAITG